MAGRIALNLPSATDRGPPLQSGGEFGDAWYDVLNNMNAMLTELFGGASTIAGNKTYSGTQQFNSTVSVQAGTSGSSYGASGNLSRNLATIGSSATNTTQTLLTYSLPPNSLAATNNGIIITAWGRKAANAAPVTLQLNVGGTAINTGAVTTSGANWTLNSEVFKTGSNAQQELFTGVFGTSVVAPKSTSDTSVDTGTITISVQALDASAAQSNVLLDGLVIEYFQ